MPQTKTLVDESGIEVLVSFTNSKSEPDDVHEDDWNSHVMTFTELHSVEVVIKGIGIDILPLMTEKQKLVIVEQINDDL